MQAAELLQSGQKESSVLEDVHSTLQDHVQALETVLLLLTHRPLMLSDLHDNAVSGRKSIPRLPSEIHQTVEEDCRWTNYSICYVPRTSPQPWQVRASGKDPELSVHLM